MHLKVVKPDEVILETDVSLVTLPGSVGQMTPMDGHDRTITLLDAGRIHFIRVKEGVEGEGEEEGVREEYEISEGMAEITHTAVTLFVEEAKRISA